MTRFKGLIAALAAIAVLAAAALVPGAGANTSFVSCTPPAVSGLNFQFLQERNLGCDRARQLAVHVARHGHPSGYTCTHRVSGRNVHWRCIHHTNPSQEFELGYYVA